MSAGNKKTAPDQVVKAPTTYYHKDANYRAVEGC